MPALLAEPGHLLGIWTCWLASAARAPTIGEIPTFKAQPVLQAPNGMGAGCGAGQCQRRRCRAQAAAHHCATTTPTPATPCLSRGYWHAKSILLMGAFSRGPGADRLCPPEKGVLPGRRAADRQIVWGGGSRHTFRLRLHLHAGGHAGAEGRRAQRNALGHRLPQLRIRPVGRCHVQKLLKQAQPVGSWPNRLRPGQVDANSVVCRPGRRQAIFNVLFAADLAGLRGQHARPVRGPRVVSHLLSPAGQYRCALRTEAPPAG